MPSLERAVFGGGDGAVDAAALAFLLADNHRLQEAEAEAEERREEEERQRREQEDAEVDHLFVEQSALVRLSVRGTISPAQEARLQLVTRRLVVLTSAQHKRKTRRKRIKRRRSLLRCSS